MITFNSILADEGLDPYDVKLVRHQDKRHAVTPFQLWVANDGRLETYQSYQRRLVFESAAYIASFVATPLNETLFIGMYSVGKVGKVPAGRIDPISGKDVGGLHEYELGKTNHLADYRGRLVIDWGPGFRSWVQRARSKDKPVVEIRRAVGDPPFPGFLDFCEHLSRLVSVPQSWRTALSSVGGIYLLVSPEAGSQYVGAAYGDGGFWARWEQYARLGHGGNVRMKDIPAADYQVCILEVTPSSASFEDVMALEARWKRKLLSREFGLNAN